jgi:hypothetical protein
MTDNINNNNTTILIPFPKIRSFKDVVHDVKKLHKQDLTFPIIEYTGKVKAHGTNASIVFSNDGTFYCQSRARVVTPLSDNNGFAAWAYRNINAIKETLNISIHYDNPADNKTVVVYGEWCGGNVQGGVALSQLPKMFIIFAIRFDMTNIIEWYGPNSIWKFNNLKDYINTDINLYNVDIFPTYKVTIDFNNPHLVQNQLVELTEAIGTECPVGKYFGVSGIGEGLVASCHDSQHDPELYNFKSKDERHVGGNWLSNIKLKANDEQKLMNLCLQNNIKDFEWSFYEDLVC